MHGAGKLLSESTLSQPGSSHRYRSTFRRFECLEQWAWAVCRSGRRTMPDQWPEALQTRAEQMGTGKRRSAFHRWSDNVRAVVEIHKRHRCFLPSPLEPPAYQACCGQAIRRADGGEIRQGGTTAHRGRGFGRQGRTYRAWNRTAHLRRGQDGRGRAGRPGQMGGWNN